jgi:hypothetical protein
MSTAQDDVVQYYKDSIAKIFTRQYDLRNISHALKSAHAAPTKAIEAIKLLAEKYADLIQITPEEKKAYDFRNRPENIVLKLQAFSETHQVPFISPAIVGSMYEEAKTQDDKARSERLAILTNRMEHRQSALDAMRAFEEFSAQYPELVIDDGYRDSESYGGFDGDLKGLAEGKGILNDNYKKLYAHTYRGIIDPTLSMLQVAPLKSKPHVDMESFKIALHVNDLIDKTNPDKALPPAETVKKLSKAQPVSLLDVLHLAGQVEQPRLLVAYEDWYGWAKPSSIASLAGKFILASAVLVGAGQIQSCAKKTFAEAHDGTLDAKVLAQSKTQQASAKATLG